MTTRSLLLLLLCTAGTAQAQFGPPRNLTEINLNNSAYRTALFDADGDADLDLILATSSEITVRRNDGTGHYLFYETNHTQLCTPVDLAWGDLDADGDIDLVQAASDLDSALIWLANDGDGHFTAQQKLLSSASEGLEVSVADMDDDGDPDIVLGAYGTSRFFRNNGAGVFDLAANLGSQLVLGLPADVDLDGDLDLVGFYPDQYEVGFRPDTGSNYGTWASIGDADWGCVQLLMLDLELDGDSDLVLVFADHLRVHLNLDSGLFAPAVLLPGGISNMLVVRAGDVNSDGMPDLVALDSERRLLLFVNNGDASFAPLVSQAPLDASVGAEDLALADIDADGSLDAITVRRASVHCHLGDGAGDFGATRVALPELSYGAASGDMDGDGDPDILLSSAWLEQGAPGEFTVMHTIGVGAPRQKAADFTGDGLMDTYTSDESDQEPDSIAWYRNSGDGQFERIPLAASWPDTWDAQAWDLDADGDLDLLRAASGSIGVIYDYRNDGAGNLIRALYDLPGGLEQVRHLAVADFDGDGDPDVACFQYWGPFSVFENEGAPYLSQSSTHEVGIFPDGIDFAYAGDLDTDGDPDLLVMGGGKLDWVENNGLGNAWPLHPITTNVDEGLNPADLGDIDGDGDLDVIYRRDDNQVVYRMNDGVGNFGSPILVPNAPYGSEMELVDMDNDGDADLILQAFTTVQVRMNYTVDISTTVRIPSHAEEPILRPNPFEEAATLELATPLTATDHVRILDVSGRVLRTIGGTGARALPIERGDLQAGVYVLQVMHGEHSSSVRMVVR